jgi:hypothetical protein
MAENFSSANLEAAAAAFARITKAAVGSYRWYTHFLLRLLGLVEERRGALSQLLLSLQLLASSLLAQLAELLASLQLQERLSPLLLHSTPSTDSAA